MWSRFAFTRESARFDRVKSPYKLPGVNQYISDYARDIFNLIKQRGRRIAVFHGLPLRSLSSMFGVGEDFIENPYEYHHYDELIDDMKEGALMSASELGQAGNEGRNTALDQIFFVTHAETPDFVDDGNGLALSYSVPIAYFLETQIIIFGPGYEELLRESIKYNNEAINKMDVLNKYISDEYASGMSQFILRNNSNSENLDEVAENLEEYIVEQLDHLGQTEITVRGALPNRFLTGIWQKGSLVYSTVTMDDKKIHNSKTISAPDIYFMSYGMWDKVSESEMNFDPNEALSILSNASDIPKSIYAKLIDAVLSDAETGFKYFLATGDTKPELVAEFIDNALNDGEDDWVEEFFLKVYDKDISLIGPDVLQYAMSNPEIIRIMIDVFGFREDLIKRLATMDHPDAPSAAAGVYSERDAQRYPYLELLKEQIKKDPGAVDNYVNLFDPDKEMLDILLKRDFIGRGFLFYIERIAQSGYDLPKEVKTKLIHDQNGAIQYLRLFGYDQEAIDAILSMDHLLPRYAMAAAKVIHDSGREVPEKLRRIVATDSHMGGRYLLAIGNDPIIIEGLASSPEGAKDLILAKEKKQGGVLEEVDPKLLRKVMEDPDQLQTLLTHLGKIPMQVASVLLEDKRSKTILADVVLQDDWRNNEVVPVVIDMIAKNPEVVQGLSALSLRHPEFAKIAMNNPRLALKYALRMRGLGYHHISRNAIEAIFQDREAGLEFFNAIKADDDHLITDSDITLGLSKIFTPEEAFDYYTKLTTAQVKPYNQFEIKESLGFMMNKISKDPELALKFILTFRDEIHGENIIQSAMQVDSPESLNVAIDIMRKRYQRDNVEPRVYIQRRISKDPGATQEYIRLFGHAPYGSEDFQPGTMKDRPRGDSPGMDDEASRVNWARFAVREAKDMS